MKQKRSGTAAGETRKAESVPAEADAIGNAAAEPLKIPPLLLEGDQPSAPIPGGPGEKFVLGPAAPAELEQAGARELPEAYGTGRMLLMANDPHWLYVHWDFTRQQQNEFNAASVDGHLVVRIRPESSADLSPTEVHVHPESRHWFVEVGRAGAQYSAELGYYDAAKQWVSIAASQSVMTPAGRNAPQTTAPFVAGKLPPVLATIAGAPAWLPGALAEEPAAESLTDLAAGQPPAKPVGTFRQAHIVPPVVGWIPILEVEARREEFQPEAWAEAKAQALAELFEQPAPSFSSAGLPSEIWQAQQQAAVSSPLAAPPIGAQGFWFNVNAELVVYGATEKGATVTAGGQPIGLREDGTFSLRLAFPDGTFELALAARSPSGELREADLQVSRRTECRGEVGIQPPGEAIPPACE